MSAGWLSVVQQLKELHKLAGKYLQHVTNQETQAALAVRPSITELGYQIGSSTTRLATAPCASPAERQEIVSKVWQRALALLVRL